MAIRAKYILKIIINIDKGLIPGTICSIHSISFNQNNGVNGIFVLFDGDSELVFLTPMPTQSSYDTNYLIISGKKFPLIHMSSHSQHHFQHLE